jgi:predicted AAA+ superfamily ATPase
MEGQIKTLLQEKLADSLAASVPPLTRREIRLPAVPGKAFAVVGMRRSGKTSYLWQCLGDRLAAGRTRESLVPLNFEDDRLSGMDASGLAFLVEEYFRLFPGQRDGALTTFLFDEIQIIPGWETFARRLLDSERIELFLSGSSASMLSREVATSMRGRAMEVTVFPFSFREALAHAGLLPEKVVTTLPKARRSALDHAFRDYLATGGFPEAQGLAVRDRAALLRSYVDVAVLRDVIERHEVSNPVALRWLQRHLLGSPASLFSIQKFYDTLRSQGISVAKDTLHAYLGHLEDAFLIRTVSLHTASERQRMVNPRKAYPIDPGLIPVYERTGQANLGQALETVVLIELLRRGYEVHYVRTPKGLEIDFHARDDAGSTLLIQVCADATDPVTFDREIRALADAVPLYPKVAPLLLTLDPHPPTAALPPGVQWRSAIDWLLSPGA